MAASSLKITLVALAAAALVGSAHAQAWSDAYNVALAAAKNGQWEEARDAFIEAKAARSDDQDKPSFLPGPVTEPVRWRSGAPYSPNFGAAYAAFRLAKEATEVDARTQWYTVAASEFEALVAKGQRAPETVKALREIYRVTEQEEALQALTSSTLPMTWKVDASFLLPEDVVTLTPGNNNQGNGQTGTNPDGTPIISGGSDATIIKVRAGQENTVFTSAADVPVEISPTKYALIVGNAESAMAEQKVDFAVSSANRVKQALTMHAGYAEENITVITNVTAAQIKAAAEALAEKMPENGTVLVYFAGVGANVDGKDYYAGTNTEFATDTSSMIAKSELQNILLSKGATVFIFNEVNRPITNGNYFGKERPVVGTIAEIQATVPGSNVYSTVEGTDRIGLFTRAFCSVFREFRSNSIPVTEFAWQVYYAIRRGPSGESGGGSLQTPTLPVLTNMGDDARF